jgi:hypothetical protein
MRVFNLTLLLTLFTVADASSQVYTSAESSSSFSSRDSLKYLFSPRTEPLMSLTSAIEFEVWANATSNVVTAGFMNTLAHGGFISHETLDPILSAHNGQKGYLGGSAGWEMRWVGKHKEDKLWTICGSMGSELIVDTRWTSDLFELVWYGNANSTGTVNYLSGSGARVGAFNRFSLGAQRFDTNQRIEISLVQRLGGAEWSLPYGYLYVSENADSLETYVQTEARIHAGPDYTLLPAYGIGISGNVPLRFDDIPIDLDINFKDVGLLFEPGGSRVYWMQDGLSTTGLPVLGDSLTWENIIDGNISTDSLVETGESVSRMVLLPSKLSIHLKHQYSENLAVSARVSAGGWMPQKLLSLGVEWEKSDNLSLGVDLRDGGWGDQRIGVWAKLKVSKGRSLFIYLEDPKGLLFQSESAVNTTCRGISFRLSKDNG